MGAAGFGGSFAPIVQYEKWEIHPVFLHFPYFQMLGLIFSLIMLLVDIVYAFVDPRIKAQYEGKKRRKAECVNNRI